MLRSSTALYKYTDRFLTIFSLIKLAAGIHQWEDKRDTQRQKKMGDEGDRERERDKERQRQTERDGGREGEGETDKQTQQKRDTQTETKRDRGRDSRDREMRERGRDRETERERDRDRDREGERDRDRESRRVHQIVCPTRKIFFFFKSLKAFTGISLPASRLLQEYSC